MGQGMVAEASCSLSGSRLKNVFSASSCGTSNGHAKFPDNLAVTVAVAVTYHIVLIYNLFIIVFLLLLIQYTSYLHNI